MSDTEAGKPSALERLFPKQEVTIRGVAINVMPLPFHQVGSLFRAFYNLWPLLDGKQTPEDIIGAAFDDVLKVLNKCVSVPEDPNLTVGDLPFEALPDLLEAFLKQSLDVGKWRALGSTISSLTGLGALRKPAMPTQGSTTPDLGT